MSDDIEQEKQALQHIAIPMEWHMPEHIKSSYADNVLVQGKQHSFVLSFFNTQIPPFVGTPEQTRTFLQSLLSIRAEGIAKVEVAPELIPQIITALQTAYDGYLAGKDEKE